MVSKLNALSHQGLDKLSPKAEMAVAIAFECLSGLDKPQQTLQIYSDLV